jgi:hypothetical protein
MYFTARLAIELCPNTAYTERALSLFAESRSSEPEGKVRGLHRQLRTGWVLSSQSNSRPI